MRIEAKERRQREQLAEHYIRLGTYIPIPIFYVTISSNYTATCTHNSELRQGYRASLRHNIILKLALNILKLCGDLVQDESVANLPVRNEACFLQLGFLIPTSVPFLDPLTCSSPALPQRLGSNLANLSLEIGLPDL